MYHYGHQQFGNGPEFPNRGHVASIHQPDRIAKKIIVPLGGALWPDAPTEAPEAQAALAHGMIEAGVSGIPEEKLGVQNLKCPLGVDMVR